MITNKDLYYTILLHFSYYNIFKLYPFYVTSSGLCFIFRFTIWILLIANLLLMPLVFPGIHLFEIMPVEPILPLYITDFVSSSSPEQRKALIKLSEDQDPYLTAGSDSNLSDGEFNSSRKSEIPSELEQNSSKTSLSSTIIPPTFTGIPDCVIHVDRLDINHDLSKDILNELTSLKLRTKGKNGRAAKVKTQWLSPKDSHRDSINATKPMSDYPCITSLMDIVNSHPSTTGDMTDCLVSCMLSKHSSLTYHADDEPSIDQNSDICTVSLGPPRTLDFMWKHKNNSGRESTSFPPKYSVPATDLSLNVMKAGSQAKILHRVPNRKEGGIRYSLSFRKVVSNPPSVKENDEVQVINNKKKIVLLAGDSYFEHLDTDKLAKGKESVFKVDRGGRKIEDVLKSTKNFLDANPTYEVKKLFVCVGTNDIRYCYDRGVNHLKTPLRTFLSTLKQLVPQAKIFIQSLLPIPYSLERKPFQ